MVYSGVYRAPQRNAHIAGYFGGLLGMFGALLAGPMSQNSVVALLLLLTLIAVGGLGIAGTILRSQRPRGACPLIVLSGAILATGGSLKLHGPLGHSFDLFGGELLLLSGELLLFTAAVHPALARTNGLRTTLATTCNGRGMVIHF